MKKISCLFFILLYTVVGLSQSTYQVGLIPRVNINQKLENNWKLNYKIESRFIGAEGAFSSSSTFNPKYNLTDVSVVASKKVGLNNALAAGYLMRFHGSKVDQRFIQQFTIIDRYSSYRLAHRFTSDQTIKKDEDNTFRLRYRLSLELPLNGHTVDENEFYLKVNHEYLNAFEVNHYDLEIRLVPLVGYVFKDTNKIEWGIDYRLGNFIHRDTTNNFWLTFNWYISI